MYEEVTTLIAARNAAMAENRTARTAANAAYKAEIEAAGLSATHTRFADGSCLACADKEARRAFEDRRRAAMDVAWDAYNAAMAASWEPLKGSADPLVRWIAENCQEYSDEALDVLSALPASMDELDRLAENNGWCGTWNRFRVAAAEAGVISVETQEVSA